jgi:hypothetical protein
MSDDVKVTEFIEPLAPANWDPTIKLDGRDLTCQSCKREFFWPNRRLHPNYARCAAPSARRKVSNRLRSGSVIRQGILARWREA